MPRPHRRRSSAPKVESEYSEHVVQVDRVTRVVAGGKRMRFRATVVVGNRKGKVGIGLGKADEVAAAVRKAVIKAKREVILVPIVNDTIPHEVRMSFKSSNVILLPASRGTGVIAGGPVRVIAEMAGIKNLLSKLYGSTNKVNVVNATIRGLQSLRVRSRNVTTEHTNQTTNAAA